VRDARCEMREGRVSAAERMGGRLVGKGKLGKMRCEGAAFRCVLLGPCHVTMQCGKFFSMAMQAGGRVHGWVHGGCVMGSATSGSAACMALRSRCRYRYRYSHGGTDGYSQTGTGTDTDTQTGTGRTERQAQTLGGWRYYPVLPLSPGHASCQVRRG
jgi:hypothetical protein